MYRYTGDLDNLKESNRLKCAYSGRPVWMLGGESGGIIRKYCTAAIFVDLKMEKFWFSSCNEHICKEYHGECPTGPRRPLTRQVHNLVLEESKDQKLIVDFFDSLKRQNDARMDSMLKKRKAPEVSEDLD